MKAKDICRIALLSATLTAAKMVLSGIANVEIVTLLLATYALTLGFKQSVIASLIFVLCEVFIWGFSSWVLLYIVYWPTLTAIFCTVRRLKFRVVYACIIGVIMTGFFGVLSTVIDAIFMGALDASSFGEYFIIRYLAGVPLFLTHIISNSIILPVALYPLSKVIARLIRPTSPPLDNA